MAIPKKSMPKKSVQDTINSAFQQAIETISNGSAHDNPPAQRQKQYLLEDDSKVVKILKLNSENPDLKQRDIAKLLDCGESYVSQVLTRYSDKRILAKRLLQASSPALAQNIIENASPDIALKTQQAMSVIEPDQQNGNVTIQVGSPDHPLQPPSIHVGTGKTS